MNGVYLYPRVMVFTNNGAKIYSWNPEERYNNRLPRAKLLRILYQWFGNSSTWTDL
ncbi:hypothetical protein L873DRAFT_1816910, partial [Choiromyces venosus 120613-1]